MIRQMQLSTDHPGKNSDIVYVVSNLNEISFPVNLRFLPCLRKNSEVKQGGKESKVRIYLSKDMLSVERGREVRGRCPGSLGVAGYAEHTSEGVEHLLGKEEFGGRIP